MFDIEREARWLNRYRSRRPIAEALEATLTDLTTFSTRGLTVTQRTLSDDVRRRPYAGKKSRRTHARVWV